MVSRVEAKIGRLLRKGRLPKELSRLVERYQDGSSEERFALASYLYNAGHHRQFLKLAVTWLKKKEPVPMAQLLSILAKTETPKKELIGATLEACGEWGTQDELISFESWEPMRSQVADIKKAAVEKWQQGYEHKKHSLKEKLQFMQAQGLLDGERQVLDQLWKLFPDDPEILSAKDSFAERWARERLQRPASTKSAYRPLEPKPIKLSDEQNTFIDQLLKFCTQNAQRHQHLIYDFSLMFYFMELYEPALNVISKSSQASENIDWYKFELLYKCGRHLECLDWATQLSVKYSADPESTFSIAYMRALSLFALGENSDAISLLKSIVQVRPNYRSAQELLRNWSEGVAYET